MCLMMFQEERKTCVLFLSPPTSIISLVHSPSAQDAQPSEKTPHFLLPIPFLLLMSKPKRKSDDMDVDEGGPGTVSKDPLDDPMQVDLEGATRGAKCPAQMWACDICGASHSGSYPWVPVWSVPTAPASSSAEAHLGQRAIKLWLCSKCST